MLYALYLLAILALSLYRFVHVQGLPPSIFPQLSKCLPRKLQCCIPDPKCPPLTLFCLPSNTAFAIRICSLLTSRRAWFQLTFLHVLASSLGAPAEAVCCIPIFRGSPNDLATEHQSDVGAPFTGVAEGRSPILVPSHVSCPIRPATGRHLLFPTSQSRPSNCLPCGWLAMHRVHGGVTTFPRSA